MGYNKTGQHGKDQNVSFQESFQALRDEKEAQSDYKAKHRRYENLQEELCNCRETLADNKYILARTDEIVAEKKAVIQRVEEDKPGFEAAVAATAAAAAAASLGLKNATDARDRELEPLNALVQEYEARISLLIDQRDEVLRDAEEFASQAQQNDANRSYLETRSSDARSKANDLEFDINEAKDKKSEVESNVREAEARHNGKISSLKIAASAATAAAGAASAKLAEALQEEQEAKNRLKRVLYVLEHPEENDELASCIAKLEPAVAKAREASDAASRHLEEVKDVTRKGKILIGVIVGIVVVAILAVGLVFCSSTGSSSSTNSNKENVTAASNTNKNSASSSNKNSSSSKNTNSNKNANANANKNTNSSSSSNQSTTSAVANTYSATDLPNGVYTGKYYSIDLSTMPSGATLIIESEQLKDFNNGQAPEVNLWGYDATVTQGSNTLFSVVVAGSNWSGVQGLIDVVHLPDFTDSDGNSLHIAVYMGKDLTTHTVTPFNLKDGTKVSSPQGIIDLEIVKQA